MDNESKTDAPMPVIPDGARAIPLMCKDRKSRIDRIVGWALVDDADYTALSRFRWGMLRSGKTNYAKRSEHVPGTTSDSTAIYMHREVLGLLPGAGHAVEADHANHQGLDNRRANLRVVTRNEQNQNRRRFDNNKSGTPNVTYVPSARGPNKWSAHIMRNGKMILHKHFATQAEAIAARDEALTLYESKRQQVSA